MTGAYPVRLRVFSSTGYSAVSGKPANQRTSGYSHRVVGNRYAALPATLAYRGCGRRNEKVRLITFRQDVETCAWGRGTRTPRLVLRFLAILRPLGEDVHNLLIQATDILLCILRQLITYPHRQIANVRRNHFLAHMTIVTPFRYQCNIYLTSHCTGSIMVAT